MTKPGRPRGKRVLVAREIAPVYGQPAGLLSRLNATVETLGNNKVAKILGVSPSQPSRWRSGKDFPSPEHQRKVVELDRVLVYLFEDMVPVVALDWLESYNHFLLTRPIDALAVGRFDDVIVAIGIEELGGFI